MKNLKVKKINVDDVVKAHDVAALLDRAQIEYQPVDVVNWPAYPYCPEVRFRIGHTGEAVLLQYKVKEKSVCARFGTDNDPVYKDSCVEFFIAPADDRIYYNLECNCIGTILLGGGEPGDRNRATTDTMDRVDRWAALGTLPFEERTGDTEWEVCLVVPASVFYMHPPVGLSGRTVRANFYKCGDDLTTPHFLSWNPIDAATPNFHLPDFFGSLYFE